ncbi:DUF6090 family protein [Arenimonas sp. MALMAid1274]|uniref:DUF6090 family protein n=1 Tax=Arenimonas sp. MALMAid1274 TaxID=3411630 RepID=UPI003BA3544B
MQLRNVTQALRNRDWSSVAMEILIVVVGVIIALQVSNWNEERKEAQRAEGYLLRMQNELRADAARLATMTRLWQAVNAEGRAALAHAEKGTLHEGSAWKTLRAYYQASQIWPYRMDDTTIQELRASGEFGLIRDPELRALISHHYAGNAGGAIEEVLGVVPAYREQVRGMTPWAIQEYLWANCYASASESQELVDCPSPVSEAEALAVLEEFRTSPSLLRHLRFWIATNGLAITLSAGLQREAGELADIIEQRER